MVAKVDSQIRKSPANLCAAAVQSAASIIGDMMSAYWAVSEGKPVPTVFLNQAKERIAAINEIIDLLKLYNLNQRRP